MQLGPDGLGLDPFGDDLDPELVGEVNGGPDDHPEARDGGHRLHQGHVELELIDGPAAKDLQRGETGAEIVEGDPHADLGELTEEGCAHRRGPGLLTHLKSKHAAGHALAPQQPGDDGGKFRVDRAIGPDIDRDRNAPSGGGPDPVLGEGQPQHQTGELPHQSQLLGASEEDSGWQGTQFGMLPSRQALRRRHPAGRQLDLGLEVGHELPARQGMRKFSQQPRRHLVGFDRRRSPQ